jgi:hypothetical protein
MSEADWSSRKRIMVRPDRPAKTEASAAVALSVESGRAGVSIVALIRRSIPFGRCRSTGRFGLQTPALHNQFLPRSALPAAPRLVAERDDHARDAPQFWLTMESRMLCETSEA